MGLYLCHPTYYKVLESEDHTEKDAEPDRCVSSRHFAMLEHLLVHSLTQQVFKETDMVPLGKMEAKKIDSPI